MVTCSSGHPNAVDTQFCAECGEDVRPHCDAGHPGVPGNAFCEICGSPLASFAVAEDTSLVSKPLAAEYRGRHVAAAMSEPDVTQHLPGDVRPGPSVAATQPAAPTHVVTAPLAPAATAPYGFVLSRLHQTDKIMGGSTAVLSVALFLPWFGAGSDGYHVSVKGLNDHSYLSFVVLTAATLLAYLAARAGWDRLPVRLPVAHAPLLLILGMLQLLLVGVAFLSEPHGFSREFGAWLALAAAFGAILPVAIPAVKSFQRT